MEVNFEKDFLGFLSTFLFVFSIDFSIFFYSLFSILFVFSIATIFTSFFKFRGPSENQVCKRTDKVYRFLFTNEVTDGSYIGGKWIEKTNTKLSTAKSGFDLLNVPKTFGRCT